MLFLRLEPSALSTLAFSLLPSLFVQLLPSDLRVVLFHWVINILGTLAVPLLSVSHMELLLSRLEDRVILAHPDHLVTPLV